MCGIAGFLAHDARAPADELARRIADHLVHRGPDAFGAWTSGPCALAHRRLSIIDLSPEANQPLLNETGDVAIVVNGEIYDFAALRRELEDKKGHRFRSKSDSEVALHLYEEHGERFAERLDGMFAILVYDAKKRRVVAARDRSGKKPLFYRVLPHGFAFASEAAALVRAFPEHAPQVDLRAIDEYLTLQYVPSPRTAYLDVHKVPAAHVAIFEPGAPAPHVQRYWSKPTGVLHGRPDDLERELIHLLRDAVKKRLVSDVPLGAFLSGGIDSSTIVALMSEASSRVKTFSVGFPDAGDSELPYARMVAKRFGTEHHEETVTPEMTNVLEDTIRHHGQPFADSSAIATYYLAKMTRKHVTVALSGDAGDELFAGYKRYTTARIGHVHDALPPIGQRMMRGALGSVVALVKPSLGDYAKMLSLGEAARYARLVGQLGAEEKHALYLEPMRDAFTDSVTSHFEGILAASTATSRMGRICDLDFNTYLEGDINPKVDIASMTHALEVRCPFLDTAVIEFAARLPPSMLMRVRGKWLLRRATRKILPSRTRMRVKRGFALPLERWMRRDLHAMTRDILESKRARERGLFDPKAVSKMIDDMEQGRASVDHVWTLLVLELWFRAFIDGT